MWSALPEPQHHVSEDLRLGRRVKQGVNIQLADVAGAEVSVRLRDKAGGRAGVVRGLRGQGSGRRDRQVASAAGKRKHQDRCNDGQADAARCLQSMTLNAIELLLDVEVDVRESYPARAASACYGGEWPSR